MKLLGRILMCIVWKNLVSALLSGRKRASFSVIVLYHKSLFLQPAIMHTDVSVRYFVHEFQ